MDTSPYDAGGYTPHPHLPNHQQYGAMAGYDTASLKFHPHPHHPHHHHGLYSDGSAMDASASFYNYMHPGGGLAMGGVVPQDYHNAGGVRDPPSYAESTVISSTTTASSGIGGVPATTSALFHPHYPHHPGFVHGSMDYYKTAGAMGGTTTPGLCGSGGGGGGGCGTLGLRSDMVVSDYGGQVGVRDSGSLPSADNFLMKQEGGGVGGVVSGGGVVGGSDNALNDDRLIGGHFLNYGRYSEEDLHHLNQQHHQHQQQNGLHHLQSAAALTQQQMPPSGPNKSMLPPPGDLQQQDEPSCKLEQDPQHDYKPHTTDLGGVPPLSSLQPQGSQEDHHHQQQPPTLPPPAPPHDVTTTTTTTDPNLSQSPCSDVTSGDGTEVTSASQDTDVNTSGELPQPQQQQQEGGEGGGGGGGESGKNSNEVKPTLSYIALIAKSILESRDQRLNLGSIYGWIEKNFPYYQNRGQGWRNSVRHNLSLNDCFIKAGRCEDGKGNYWAIHPANLQDFHRGDFRQRRRSRRRGRKKDCDLGLYHPHHHHHAHAQYAASTNTYLGAAAAAAAGSSLGVGVGVGVGVGTQMPYSSPAAALYSPYTEAERRAYRLDEALLRQSMNNPFLKWYHHQPSSAYTPTTSPSSSGMVSPVGQGVYGGMGGVGVGVGMGGGSSSSSAAAAAAAAAASNAQWPPQTYPENNGYPLSSSSSFSSPRNYSAPAIV